MLIEIDNVKKRKLDQLSDNDDHDPMEKTTATTISSASTSSPPSKRLRPRKNVSYRPILKSNKRKIQFNHQKNKIINQNQINKIKIQELFKLRKDLNETRKKNFLQAHKDLFLSLLPNSQHYHFIQFINQNENPQDISKLDSMTQPSSIKGQMKPYQVIGLQFLLNLHFNAISGILADEMGLGKTLQTLALLAHLKQINQLYTPNLIICPLSVLSSWVAEIKRWTNLTFAAFRGSKTNRTALKKSLLGLGTDGRDGNNFDLLVVTYESFLLENSWFKHRHWGYVILDEGHRIKTPNTLISNALQSIQSTNRLILTGTPIQNNLIELWALFHWLMPDIFTKNTLERFRNAFDLTNGTYDHQFFDSSQRLLKLIMLRRTKESVKSQLTVPPRQEITLYVPMSNCQRFWTKRLILKCDESSLHDIFNTQNNQQLTSNRRLSAPIQYALQAEASNNVSNQSYKNLMNLLMQLRKICNHPYLMPNSEPEPFEIAEHIVEASSKLVMLDKIFKSELPKGKRFLIFSGFTSMLNILEDFLKLRSIEFLRLDGSTPVARRNLAIRIFQQTGPVFSNESQSAKVVPIFLISTKAGGLGINLTAADNVIMYDSSWNPQTDIQAIARAHRIGQTKNVTVYRLVCAESVEQQMMGRLRKKLYLSLKIMDDQVNNSIEGINASNQENDLDQMNSMSSQDLCSILRAGTASALHKHWGKADLEDEDERSGYNEFLNASFEQIVERAKEFQRAEIIKAELDRNSNSDQVVSKSDQEMLQKIEDEEMELLKGIEVVRTRIFEGKIYEIDNEVSDKWRTALQTSKRVSKSTTTIVDGHIVQSESITNGRWQAVKTITSDPIALSKLQTQKRIKKHFDHEESCLACHEGGQLYLCNFCPRVAHYQCLGYSTSDLKKMVIFKCSQHNCVTCHRTCEESGGMLYRCQTCPDAYCEDCLSDDKFYSIGDELPEFMILNYGAALQVHYIRCVECLKHFEKFPETLKIWDQESARVKSLLDNQKQIVILD